MTTSVTLTTSWQEIAGEDGSKVASFETDGEIHAALSISQPTGTNYHVLSDGDVYGGVTSKKLWAKMDSDTTTAVAKVDHETDSAEFGSGLNLINVAAGIFLGR